jgi:hypothetical protein
MEEKGTGGETVGSKRNDSNEEALDGFEIFDNSAGKPPEIVPSASSLHLVHYESPGCAGN